MKYPMDKLGSHIDILSGFAFKSSDFIGSGIPVIKIKNITPPSVTLEDLSFVSEEIAEQQTKFILNFDDVLIALTGSHINQMASVVGRVARVKYNVPSLLNQRVGKITVLNPAESNIDYIYYYLSQDSVKIKLASKAGGAANQANISPTDIKNLIIPFPDIAIQNKIACILSAYDNLIENNQKQIKLLEEAAQRLYKEWFIDLRFPGYENTPVHDGVPEGWERCAVSDFGMVITGKTPLTENADYFGGEIPFIKIPDMHQGIFPVESETYLTTIGADSQKNKYIPKNSIMVSCIATVGLVNISAGICQTNQQINSVILNNELDLYYLYFALKDIKLILEGVGSNGATMTNVNKAKFSNLPIVKPISVLRNRFHSISKPFFDNILALTIENKKLIEARDRLLPKLMSGEIEI